MKATRLLVSSSCKSLDLNGLLVREIFHFALYLDYFGLFLFTLNFSVGIRLLACHLFCLPKFSFCCSH